MLVKYEEQKESDSEKYSQFFIATKKLLGEYNVNKVYAHVELFMRT